MSDDLHSRLVSVQNILRNVAGMAEEHAESCNAIGEPGLAVAIHMVRESILAYSLALGRWGEKNLSGQGDGDQ